MRRAVVDADGRLDLGAAAELAGYTPGAVVNVLVTLAGSLIISLADDDSQAVDVFARRLPPSKQLAISGGKL